MSAIPSTFSTNTTGNPTIQPIRQLYEKLNYFDQYGGSVVLFIFITLVVLLTTAYFQTMINIQPVIDDWQNQRCKPQYIPFAGWITKPDGMTAGEYTLDNFHYCAQNILSNTTATATQPLTYITQLLQQFANRIQDAIQSIRSMFDKVRTSMQAVSEEIMGRILNVTVPLVQIIIGMRDLVGKIQGTMTAGLYTLLGSYFTLQSLMGAIAEFILMILVGLAAMIAAFWAVPFTWGAAVANTAIFVAIAVPMAIILSFMSSSLQVNAGSVPKLKCFDGNTFIQMASGARKPIRDVQVGEYLHDFNQVTAKMCVETKGSIMYSLYDIVVSDSHLVKYGNNWIRVSQHPHARRLAQYEEPYLWCLNTTHKNIKIKGVEFSDWDELFGQHLCHFMYNAHIHFIPDIHAELDYGLDGRTLLPTQEGRLVPISSVRVGDVMWNGTKVYGVVEIDGVNIHHQHIYQLDPSHYGEALSPSSALTIEGYCPILLPYCRHVNSRTPEHRSNKLYHLLTHTGFVFITPYICVKDYNYAVQQYSYDRD